MSALPESARPVIESDHLANVVTMNRDGTPQMTCVWVGLEGDEIVFASMSDRQKLRNLRRDPRIWLSIATGNRNTAGLEEYLVVHGTARIAVGGGAEVLQHLAHTYLGPGVKFPPMRHSSPGFVVHIEVERVGGVGPWSPD